MVASTAASHTLEEMEEGDGPRWYQLYWPTDDAVTASLVGRARAAGYTVLVVTLDTWQLGWRPHDLDAAYLPFLRGIGTAVPFSDPAFRAALAHPPEDDLAAAVAYRPKIFHGTARGWSHLDGCGRGGTDPSCSRASSTPTTPGPRSTPGWTA